MRLFPPLFLPLPQQIKRLDRREGVEAGAGQRLAEFLGGVEEEGKLVGVDFAVGFAGSADARAADVLDGKLAEKLARAIEDLAWHTGETRDVNAIRAVGAAFDDAMKEDH